MNTPATKTTQLTFNEAMRAADRGELVCQAGDLETFVFRQVPSRVPHELILKMSSLPPKVKTLLHGRGLDLHCNNQYARVYAKSGITGLYATDEEMAAEDWMVIDLPDSGLIESAPVSETVGKCIPDGSADARKDDRAIEAIRGERAYQEKKWPGHTHSVAEWLLIIEKLCSDARRAWVTGHGDNGALHDVRQITATGLACLEQCGAPLRGEPIIGRKYPS